MPALPGCASEGETFDELMTNLREAIGGWLEADVEPAVAGRRERVVDLVL